MTIGITYALLLAAALSEELTATVIHKALLRARLDANMFLLCQKPVLCRAIGH